MRTCHSLYDQSMKTTGVLVAALLAGALGLAACNESGLAEKPRANFAHLACLDVNGDSRINASDAGDPSALPDFNADDDHDDFDASFVERVEIALAPDAKQACEEAPDANPEYLVAHDFLEDADVTCAPGDRAVLVVGIAGGVDDLTDDDQAAGVREIVNATISRLEGADIQTIGVVAGAAFYGAENAHAAMESWLTNAIAVYLDAFPCLDVATVGFSHGGVTVTAVASGLEDAGLSDRIVVTVILDRIEDYYNGDLTSMPHSSALVSVYQRNTPGGAPVDGATVFNYDASQDTAPADDGKDSELPVTHVTIDNSKAVRDLIANVVLARANDAAR